MKDNADLAVNLPVEALHIDLARCPEQLDSILNILPADKILSLGVVDGRNIWKNDLEKSTELVNKATGKLGADRVFVAGSCSFLHVPYDLALETKEQNLPAGIKRWMAFAAQKIEELAAIKALAEGETKEGFSHQEKTAEQDYAAGIQAYFTENQKDISDRKVSSLIHNPEVKARVAALTDKDSQRHSAFRTPSPALSYHHHRLVSSNQRGALMAFQVQEGRNFGCRIQSTAEGRNPKMHRMAGGDWTGCAGARRV